MRTLKIISLLGAVAIFASLGDLRSASAQEAPVQESENRRVKVTVVNNNWADIRVYAVSSSYTVRLGTVSGLSKATFEVPRALPIQARDFQLAVRPIGRRAVHYSHPILASPGDTIEFTVQNHLALSSAIVY